MATTTATIVNTLVELALVSSVNVKDELLNKTVPQLMKDYVLPHCLCLPRSGLRYPRIDGRYMKLMAKHGQDFLAADYELGSILLELAMQRITKHPDLPAIDYKGNLPVGYQQYSAASCNRDGYNGCPDEPGLWGTEEVEFLLKQLPTCIALREKKYSEHAKTILFQLITKLGKSSYAGGIDWLELRHCAWYANEVLNEALAMCSKCGFVRLMVDRCVADNWRNGFALYNASFFSKDDMDYLLSKMDLEKETYYKGFKRFCLKLVGQYGKKTKQQIRKEILRAK